MIIISETYKEAYNKPTTIIWQLERQHIHLIL